MELKINLSELQKRKLFVAIPAYGGMTTGIFAKSFAELSSLCTSYGITLRTYFLFNESLIQRARNYCADEFMRSDCTHMMFIDADIGFEAHSVIDMLAIADPDSDYDILGGPYAKKTLSAEKLILAVNKGLCDKDPNDLEKFVGDYVFNPLPGTENIQLNEPVEVMDLGTGYLMCQRKVFERMNESYPEKLYRPDHVRTEAFDGSREIMAYFDCTIDPETKRYLSEDYHFVQYARKIGCHVYLLPWIKLIHVGSYMFGQGGLEAMALLGTSPTASPDMIKKK